MCEEKQHMHFLSMNLSNGNDVENREREKMLTKLDSCRTFD